MPNQFRCRSPGTNQDLQCEMTYNLDLNNLENQVGVRIIKLTFMMRFDQVQPLAFVLEKIYEKS